MPSVRQLRTLQPGMHSPSLLIELLFCNSKSSYAISSLSLYFRLRPEKQAPETIKPLVSITLLTRRSKGLRRLSCSDGRIDPLTALHQSAEYQQHLARLMELVASPVLQTLRTARVQAQWRQQQARDLRDLLHHRSHAGIECICFSILISGDPARGPHARTGDGFVLWSLPVGRFV